MFPRFLTSGIRKDLFIADWTCFAPLPLFVTSSAIEIHLPISRTPILPAVRHHGHMAIRKRQSVKRTSYRRRNIALTTAGAGAGCQLKVASVPLTHELTLCAHACETSINACMNACLCRVTRYLPSSSSATNACAVQV